jgi:hypothetical protein
MIFAGGSADDFLPCYPETDGRLRRLPLHLKTKHRSSYEYIKQPVEK